jgi:hypothetical protein
MYVFVAVMEMAGARATPGHDAPVGILYTVAHCVVLGRPGCPHGVRMRVMARQKETADMMKKLLLAGSFAAGAFGQRAGR